MKSIIYFKRLFALLCFLIPVSLCAQTSSKLIEEMTWLDVKAVLEETRVVIIPLGTAAKEHGPHLPMNNDFIMANYLRDRVLEKTNHILATPTISYHYYSTFVEYPGTISLSFQTSLGIILDTCHVLAKQGFKKFYILNTGIRTLEVLKVAKNILTSEGIMMDYLDLNEALNQPIINKLIKEERGTHADEVETSMMLYISPQVVNMAKAKKDDNPKSGLPGAGLSPDPNNKTKTYSPTGSWGDPTLANKKKGEIITEVLVEYLIKSISKLANA